MKHSAGDPSPVKGLSPPLAEPLGPRGRYPLVVVWLSEHLVFLSMGAHPLSGCPTHGGGGWYSPGGTLQEAVQRVSFCRGYGTRGHNIRGSLSSVGEMVFSEETATCVDSGN